MLVGEMLQYGDVTALSTAHHICWWFRAGAPASPGSVSAVPIPMAVMLHLYKVDDIIFQAPSFGLV